MSEPPGRELILRRIRQALGGEGLPADGDGAVTIPRHYHLEHRPDASERRAVFEERLVDYGATVQTCAPDQVAATVSRLVAPDAVLLAPADLDPTWLPGGWPADRLMTDDGALTPDEVDRAGTVLTSSAAAIAETGTIVLDGGPGQGRRLLSLLPDHHVCVVRTDQIAGGVPEVIRDLQPTRPLTWISGPSATSDIELSRVQEVHGPRRLDVILVEM